MTHHGRWRILAVLFAVRAAMAFQFQSVAAIAPLLGRDLGIQLADVGLLIGLYLMPGIVLALPGGAIGQWLGDKRAVLYGLVLMITGGLIMAAFPAWEAQIAGRLLAGVGGILLNVLMSKMVTDWFAGREIATAMAIFVNSWPAGIAVALVALPAIGTAYGVGAVFLATAVLLVLALILLALLYQPPAGEASAPATIITKLDHATRNAVILAGVTWGLYNIGFAIIFSFGPLLLTEQGWSVTAAGSAASLMLWMALVSIPLGGLLADRTGRPDSIMVVGCLSAALLLLLASRLHPLQLFVALGICGGLPAGAIMSLPARVLVPGTRALGMGIFYTVFYVAMAIGPMIAGWIATRAGTAVAAFQFGAVVLAACLPSLWLFRRPVRSPAASVERRAG